MKVSYPNCRTISSTGPRRDATSSPAAGARMTLQTAIAASQRLASELLLQIQPLPDVHKPGGDQGSLPRDFHVTLSLVEFQGAKVVGRHVEADGLLTRVPGEVFRR